jgi:hypothetical protein
LSSVVFVHIGPVIPPYAADAIRQAARFSTGPLYLVAERAAIRGFSYTDIPRLVPVTCEDLGYSLLHQEFRRICPFNRSFRAGFATFTTERFFFLASLAERLTLEHVVHLENDVMLYADLDSLKPKLAGLYDGIAVPFDRDDRCIPSFMYCRHSQALSDLCQFIVDRLRAQPDPRLNDMVLLAEAQRRLSPKGLGALPVLPPFHSAPLVNQSGVRASEPALFTQNALQLEIVFDAAAIGQYLGGPDPRNFQAKRRRWYHVFKKRKKPPVRWPGPGFVNPDCLYSPALYSYEWRLDAASRLVPYMLQDQASIPIANLHIHSKNLAAFSSVPSQIRNLS